MEFAEAVERVGQAVEATGVAIVVVGAAGATVVYLGRWRRRPAEEQYRRYRQAVGRAILLGLEFLLAGDIIRTVAVDPSFRSVGVLAMIVAIRTFLSLELELEIDGRWPWERRDDRGTTPAASSVGARDPS